MYKRKEIIRHEGGYLVRVFQCIDGFRARYGEAPTKLNLGKVAHEGFSHHLTEFGMQLLKSRIKIDIDFIESDRISAADDLNRVLDYGWYGETPDIDVYQWLGVEKI